MNPLRRSLDPRFSVSAAVFLLAALVYGITLRNGFVFDDRAAVQDNPAVQSLDGIPRLLLSPYWSGEGLSNRLYRPATMISFVLNRALLGSAPAGFHLINLMLHGLIAALLFRLLDTQFGSVPLALTGAALFAVHPLLSEAVSGVVGRAELLSAFCLLGALHLDRDRAAGSRAVVPLVGMLFLLALLSKENALAFPLILLLTDGVLGRPPGISARRRWMEIALLGGVAAVYLALRWAALGSLMETGAIPEIDNPAAHLPALQRIATAFAMVPRYLGLFLFPAKLSADYSAVQIVPASGPSDPAALGGLALVLGLVILAVRGRRRFPALTWGIGFAGCAFALVSNLAFPIGTLFAERLMYLPAIGLCAACGALAALLHAKRPRTTRATVGVILVLLAGRTWARNREWKDDFTLFRAAERVSPRSSKVQYNLGNAYRRRGEIGLAIGHYRRCLELFPRYVPARRNLAVALTDTGSSNEAVEILRRLVAEEPKRASLYNNLGNAYLALGRLPEAETAYRTAVSLDPASADAHNNLAVIHQGRGDLPAAEEELLEAVRLSPDSARFRIALGDLFLKEQRPQEARGAFAEAVERAPDSAEAERGLGESLLRLSRSREAEAVLQRSLKLNPRQWEATALLGYLHQQQGEDQEAERYYLSSLAVRPGQPELRQNLGVIYMRRPDGKSKAIEQFRRCLELNPPEPIASAVRRMLSDLEGSRENQR
ncbi:MAG TPA: tetratricopeptide repeat protein [Candidatus Polarisedimenticolia bacterium]|nr:tetratricopeptide repeat protein [Candidatus Polarisedimenticolia bacterium]